MATQPPRKTGRPRRDIVVIGASAGGVTALLALAKTLPADFPAPLFVVLHVAPDSPSLMPQLLNSVSALEARHPQNGETVRPGVIYMAPPDHHLLLEDDRVLVARGPKENRFRPSIDALFRSAAYTYGPRVLGVVLTGYLDDGTSGLWSVQRMGGLAIVQDPHDAEQPAMPTNALEFVEPDYIVTLAQLGPLLVRLTLEAAPAKTRLPAPQLDLLKVELTIAKQGGGFELGIIEKGKLTPFTCPDCHGALTQLIEGNLVRYRCHTGHAYTVSALLSEVTESVESMLYQAMRGLEETKMLLHNLGVHFVAHHKPVVASLFFEKAEEAGLQAQVVHESIQKQEALSGDLQFYPKKLK